MLRLRVVLAVVIAVFALSAISVASASAAPIFEAEEGAGKTAEIEPTGDVVTEAFVLSAAGQPTIECKEVVPHGQIAVGTSAGTSSSIEFKTCKDVSAESTCAVAEPIKVKETNIALEGTAAAASAKFTPKSGTEFTTIELKNKGEASCALKGTKLKVTGTATSVAANYEAHEKFHKLSFNISNGELKYAEKAATFKGAVEIHFRFVGFEALINWWLA